MPEGEKRPADVVGAAAMVAKITTGEIEDDGKNKAALVLGRIERQAQRFGQAGEGGKRRFDLAFVVGRLDHIGGDHQQTARHPRIRSPDTHQQAEDSISIVDLLGPVYIQC